MTYAIRSLLIAALLTAPALAADSFNELFITSGGDAALEGGWLLNENAGTTAVADWTGHSVSGTASAATSSLTTTGPNSWATAAFNLNGTSGQVTLSPTPINGAESSNAWTIGCYANADNATNDGALVAQWAASNTQLMLWHDVDGAGDGIAAIVFGGAGATSIGTDSADGLTSTWKAVAGTWDGSNIRTYVNGSQTATTSGARTMSSSSSALRLGNDGSIAGRFFDGKIAFAYMFSRALTAAEVDEVADGPELVNSVAPVVSGTETQGQTLSCTTGTWALPSPFSGGSNGAASYAYQWTRSDDGTGTGEADIGGATSSTYTLAAGDVGKYVRCRVRASNTGGHDPDADTNSNFTGSIASSGGASPVPIFMHHYKGLR